MPVFLTSGESSDHTAEREQQPRQLDSVIAAETWTNKLGPGQGCECQSNRDGGKRQAREPRHRARPVSPAHQKFAPAENQRDGWQSEEYPSYGKPHRNTCLNSSFERA